MGWKHSPLGPIEDHPLSMWIAPLTAALRWILSRINKGGTAGILSSLYRTGGFLIMFEL